MLYALYSIPHILFFSLAAWNLVSVDWTRILNLYTLITSLMKSYLYPCHCHHCCHHCMAITTIPTILLQQFHTSVKGSTYFPSLPLLLLFPNIFFHYGVTRSINASHHWYHYCMVHISHALYLCHSLIDMELEALWHAFNGWVYLFNFMWCYSPSKLNCLSMFLHVQHNMLLLSYSHLVSVLLFELQPLILFITSLHL